MYYKFCENHIFYTGFYEALFVLYFEKRAFWGRSAVFWGAVGRVFGRHAAPYFFSIFSLQKRAKVRFGAGRGKNLSFNNKRFYYYTMVI